MKKLVSLLIALALVFSLVACTLPNTGNNENQNTPGDSSNGTSSFDKNYVSFLSAYEEASRLGFEGNLDEFIALISGKDGAPGKDGADGISINNLFVDNKGNLIVLLSNGESVNCGKITGEEGKDGAPGKDGTDGITPTIEISADGYWVINGVKTEYKALGSDGKDGQDGAPGQDGTDGKDGEDGTTPTIEISADGYWVINGV